MANFYWSYNLKPPKNQKKAKVFFYKVITKGPVLNVDCCCLSFFLLFNQETINFSALSLKFLNIFAKKSWYFKRSPYKTYNTDCSQKKRKKNLSQKTSKPNIIAKCISFFFLNFIWNDVMLYNQQPVFFWNIFRSNKNLKRLVSNKATYTKTHIPRK